MSYFAKFRHSLPGWWKINAPHQENDKISLPSSKKKTNKPMHPPYPFLTIWMKYFQYELPFFTDHCFTVIRRCAVLFNALLVSLLKRRHALFWLSIIMDFFLFDLLNHGFIDLENYMLGIQIAVFFLWSA